MTKPPEQINRDDYRALSPEDASTLRRAWAQLDPRATTPNGAPFPLRSWPPDAAIDIQHLAEWVDQLGVWKTYSSTIGGALTPGNATVEARYSQVGRTITAGVYILFGSTTAMASGTFTVTLPTTPSANRAFVSTVGLYSTNNSSHYTGFARRNGNTLRVGKWPGTEGVELGFGAASPFTWKAGDEVYVQAIYETL